MANVRTAMGVDLPEGFACYKLDEVWDASEEPGVYAWYSTPVIGSYDLNAFDPLKPGDPSTDSMARLVADFARAHCPPDITVALNQTFSTAWDALARPVDQSGLILCRPAMVYTLGDPLARLVLKQALDCITPMLSAPLYIGKSKNLRSRLLSHAAVFGDSAVRESALRSVDDDEVAFATFAERYLAAGLQPGHLSVWVLNLAQIVAPPSGSLALERVAEALETLLNHCYRPLMGKK